MTEKTQKEEIERIKAATKGEVLYISKRNDRAKNALYETLFKESGRKYHVTYRRSSDEFLWVVGKCKFSFFAA